MLQKNVSRFLMVKVVQFILGNVGVELFVSWQTRFISTQYPSGH
jgi:hypothetical protein